MYLINYLNFIKFYKVHRIGANGNKNIIFWRSMDPSKDSARNGELAHDFTFKLINNDLSPSIIINSIGFNYIFHSYWKYYTDFYGNGIRGDIKFRRESCRNTSMIQQAIKIIG